MSEQENFIHQMIVSLRTQLLVMGASTEIAVDNMRNAIMKMDAPTAQASSTAMTPSIFWKIRLIPLP